MWRASLEDCVQDPKPEFITRDLPVLGVGPHTSIQHAVDAASGSGGKRFDAGDPHGYATSLDLHGPHRLVA